MQASHAAHAGPDWPLVSQSGWGMAAMLRARWASGAWRPLSSCYPQGRPKQDQDWGIELVCAWVLGPDPKGQSGTRYQPQATMSVLYTPKIWCTPRKMESNTQTNLPADTLFNHLERSRKPQVIRRSCWVCTLRQPLLKLSSLPSERSQITLQT